MRFRLCLLVVLAVVVGFNHASKIRDAAEPCMKTCTEEEKVESRWICSNEGNYMSLCRKRCMEDYPAEEIECKKGTFYYCWNNECTNEEKDGKHKFCYIDPYWRHRSSTYLGCNIKCDYKSREGGEKKDIKWIDCKDDD